MTFNGGTFVANKPALSQPALEWALYPNPAQRAVTIQFSATRPGRVRATLLNLTGKNLDVLLDENVSAGDFSASLPLGLPPGCYMVRLESQGQVSVKKLIIQ